MLFLHEILYVLINFWIILYHYYRLRDERGDDRLDREQKSRDRDNHSRNGSSNGHSPVLNLSKSNTDHHSTGERSDRSDAHSPDLSAHEGDRDDDNISEINASEVDDRHDDKEDGKHNQYFIFSNVSK